MYDLIWLLGLPQIDMALARNTGYTKSAGATFVSSCINDIRADGSSNSTRGSPCACQMLEVCSLLSFSPFKVLYVAIHLPAKCLALEFA